MFEKWWETHSRMVTCPKEEAKAIYTSAVLDVADFIKDQRNEIPAVGHEFYKTILYALDQNL